jgi:excisionase family DNA binding protein
MGEILTIDEAAERLKLKSDTVRDWCLKGKLRASKLGRIWRIDAAALEELMRGQRPEPSAVPTLGAQTPPANRDLPPPILSAADTPQARKAALVARLQALQAEGLSHQAIAKRLNDDGVPTISGRGQWQKGTISNLLAQAEG